METLKTGSKAYLDSFGGLIPCVVTAITSKYGRGHIGHVSSSFDAEIQITATRGAYKRGERLHDSSLWVIPRRSVCNGLTRTIRPYWVQAD